MLELSIESGNIKKISLLLQYIWNVVAWKMYPSRPEIKKCQSRLRHRRRCHQPNRQPATV
jgi:hypothetical protein